MEIYEGLDFRVKSSAVSLGKFDGIHRGHRVLLREILSRQGLVPTVFTFGAARGNGVMPKQQIYSKREQQIILQRIGIQREIIFPFCEETKKISAEEFIEKVLIEKLDTRYICVGEDFRFGSRRQGTVELLESCAGQYGYELTVFPKLEEENEVISSTRIRWELSVGKLEMVNELLGEPYFICGKVVHGNALGRTIKMPTANLVPEPEKVLPVFGVYATTVMVDQERYCGVTNIGLKPTVGAEEVSVETHLLDFDGDLYDREIIVSFHHFIRREKKFADIDMLRAQMERDKQCARELYIKYYEKGTVSG